MKKHIIIKVAYIFNNRIPENTPTWRKFINDKSIIIESFYPEFDNIFKNNNLDFWITREYQSSLKTNTWSNEEISAGLNRFYRIILQRDYNFPENFVNQIKLLPSIEDAREIEVVESEFPIQVSIQASKSFNNALDQIYLSYAHIFTKGLPEIRIAVLDTGVNLNHKELVGKIIKRADFVNLEGLDTTQFVGDFKDLDNVPEDEVGHGTHVSGIIASKGIAMDIGVCPECNLIEVRVLASMKNGEKLVGAGIIDNINNGIKWAVDNGADVINMSLGIVHEGGGLPHEEVINYALSKNVTIVAASGNDGTNKKYYPGALSGVIAVGATDNSGEVANFSSYGANITVIAPGSNIYSSYVNNTYAFASGTSQASPFVAGAIGLMKSFAKENGKSLTNNEIKYILKHTSDKVDSRLRNERAGYGMLNLADAFKFLNYYLN